HGGGFRVGRLNYVPQDAIDDVLLKNSQVAVRQQVHLIGLQLQARPVRHIPQGDFAEVRKACLGTDGGELRHDDLNLIIGVLIGPGLYFRKFGIDPGDRVFIRITTLHGSALERRSRKRPTSATTPTAWPVPRSLTFVATAGLMSTQTIFTQLGSMFP